MTRLTIEVVTDSVASCVNAQTGGADRVELCDNLFEGGTTPSAGMIKLVREKVSIGLMVMIRPRGGDFLYSEEEFEVMKEDIKVAKSLGVDGVVFGLLTPQGDVDKQKTKELIDLARPLQVTFHRAFDMVADPFQALEDLIELGVDRILTSGLERTALEGADLLNELIEKAGDRIVILVGGGIRPYNLKKIVEKTGAKECHVSGRQPVESKMQFRNGRVSMGGALQQPEFSISVVDSNLIAALRD
ncbi:copper homeostasis protein CutC [Fulvivirga sediminis]|uniref:PF03932 family protein CutC n=1 Tax=Fulvivirga sediminis TaxID=2803949 RepID=A0A937F8L5_9BACT|nr:copper homeostasis protein CutC [Fulvivirga sediminis]MBL3656280.1 copper homeostasis protein CutC [Fulvivirga sediminis]